ncbi:MAG: HAD family phosphatase [Acidobacteria bacterium]|nr:MAG: HAD family phosphatase [Acidobacteriota bacterium]
MLKAIIFDFNGVICNDEPIHQSAMQKVLEEEGIVVLLEDYLSTYLGRDDRDCFRIALQQSGRSVSAGIIASLIQRKSLYYHQSIRQSLEVFPGVISFIQRANQHYELAVASGALRGEIEFVLERLALRNRFRCVISSHEIEKGKPEPDIFLKALEGINLSRNHHGLILPGDCLVIEDSQAGIKAALAAGMKCLAVTNTYSSAELAAAHQVVPSLEINPVCLQSLFSD